MKIAALQMQAAAGNVEANLDRIAGAAREAAGTGARLLIAPELAITGYGSGEANRAMAEPADGKVVARLMQLSTDTGIAIITGFSELADGKVWNSAVFVDGDKAPIVYRKSHLYAEYEKALFEAGTPSAVTVDLDGIKLGMLICYDVEFPENARRLARAGCKLIAVPTALPKGPYAAFIARRMVPVRAFENQVFVAYVNHCGADALFSYAGLTTIAAPDGSELASADATKEIVLFAELDVGGYAQSATQNTYLRDLRTT